MSALAPSVPAPPLDRAARFLAIPGWDAPDAVALKSRALRILVPLTLGNEMLFEHKYKLAVPLLLLAAVVVSGRGVRIAASLLLALLLFVTVTSFPIVANHMYLAILLTALCAALDAEDAREQELLVQAARWLVVAVLFWSGAKKLAYGSYFHGEYLAYDIATDFRFAEFFGVFFPEQVARLQSYAGAANTGPYRMDGGAGVAFTALSNAVWIGEMGVPVLLCWKRARPYAWAAGLALMLGIEVVAREAFFGMLFSGVLLSFAAGPLVWRALPWIAALQVLLVAASLAGFAPPGMS